MFLKEFDERIALVIDAPVDAPLHGTHEVLVYLYGTFTEVQKGKEQPVQFSRPSLRLP